MSIIKEEPKDPLNQEQLQPANISFGHASHFKSQGQRRENDGSVSVNPKRKEKRRQKDHKRNRWLEEWQPQEVKRVFHLFDRFGSQWRLFSQYITNRPVNSIKNRFYTAIRVMLKALFKNHPQISGKYPYEIPSKEIVRFYEARQSFSSYPGFAKRLLEETNYEINEAKISQVCQKYSQQIWKIYTIIFKKQEADEEKNVIEVEPKIQQMQPEPRPTVQVNNQYQFNGSVQFIQYPPPPYYWGYPQIPYFFSHPPQ